MVQGQTDKGRKYDSLVVNLCIGAKKVLVLGSGPFGVLERKLLTTYPHIEVTSVDLTPPTFWANVTALWCLTSIHNFNQT